MDEIIKRPESAEDARREAEMGWQPRDLDAKPYTADELRVCDYLRLITDDQIGCGDDPVSFLIASHNYQNMLLKDERAKSEGLRVALTNLAYAICDGEEHGEGADETGCLICDAIRDARAALSASPSPSLQPPSD